MYSSHRISYDNYRHGVALLSSNSMKSNTTAAAPSNAAVKITPYITAFDLK